MKEAKHNLKNKKILYLILGLIAVGLILVKILLFSEAEVSYTEVEKGRVVNSFENSGVIKSKNQVISYAEVNTTVENIFLSEGDVVKKGDIIAELDSSLVEKEIEKVSFQITSLEYSKKDALKQSDKEYIIKATSVYNTAKINYDEAKKTFDNNKELFEAEAISKYEYDGSLSNLNIANETMIAAEQDIKIITSSNTNVSRKFSADINALSTGLDMLFDARSKYQIIAETDGILTEKFVGENEYVMPGTKLFEIADTETIYFEANIIDTDAKLLKEEAKTIIKIDDETAYDGVIEKIYPKAYDIISDLGVLQKRIKVDILPVESIVNLRLNQEFDIEFILEDNEDVLRVKKDDVFKKNGKFFVMVNEGGILKTKEITIGLKGNDYYQVDGGIKEKDRIVIDLSEDIEVGAKIK